MEKKKKVAKSRIGNATVEATFWQCGECRCQFLWSPIAAQAPKFCPHCGAEFKK